MACQAAYQELFNEIRQATNGGYVFVRCKFQREVALAVARRTWREAQGRPQKAHLEEGQEKFSF